MRSEHTLNTLRAYAPTDPSELEHRDRMVALLTTSGDAAFDRTHWTPGHFTASAFVLSPGGDSVLLIHHGKLDRWLQPGGHIETEDSSAFDAALREVEEEVGVSPTSLSSDRSLFDVDIHPIPARGADPGHEHFDLRFLFRATSDRFDAGDEVKDARWWDLKALASHAEDPSVARAVRKLVKRD
ncbi:MAG: NUDIX hydrolase [Myxococcota bacterium]